MGNSLVRVFKESAKSLINNPLFFVPPVVSIVFLTLLSMFSIKINYIIGNSNSFLITGWYIAFSLVSLLGLSYLFSGLIAMCFSSVKGKVRARDFFSGANKYWLKNFIILLIIVVCYDVLNIIAIYGTYYLGKSIGLSLLLARFLFFFIFFAGLIGGIIFLTFSNFFLIYENPGILKSIRKSAGFVSNNYLSVLAIIIAFFVILQIISYIGPFEIGGLSLTELISNIIIYPYLALVLARFLYERKEKK